MDPDGSFFFASVTIRMKEKICADQIGIYSTHPPSHMSPYFFKKKSPSRHMAWEQGIIDGHMGRPAQPEHDAGQARSGPARRSPMDFVLVPGDTMG
jgi:hypothetical protein